jgi:ABC-type Mn2+/Zn2+ transport system permease subunit
MLGYALAIGSYLAGLGVSLITDLPSSPVIVWVMGILGFFVHLTGRNGQAPGTVRESH